MLKFVKSRTLSYISIIWCQFYAYIKLFRTFGVSVQAKGSLRDLRYFFSTNNLRLVKIFSRDHEWSSRSKNVQMMKLCIMLKVFWRSSMSLSCWNHQNTEITKIGYISCFVLISRRILNFFGDSIFLSKHKVLYGISDIFSRQTIWDLLKVFWRSSMSLSCWNHQNTEITKIGYISCFVLIYRHILNVFGNSIFFTKQRVLCEISNIFPRQTIWDLSKNFLTTSMCLSHWNHQKHENALLVKFPIYLMSILGIYWTFLGILHFCPSTSRSAGSQIFFLDKQSETC